MVKRQSNPEWVPDRKQRKRKEPTREKKNLWQRNYLEKLKQDKQSKRYKKYQQMRHRNYLAKKARLYLDPDLKQDADKKETTKLLG